MKTIEFFGVPCSGKTYVYNLLINKFNLNQNKIYTYKSVIFKFAKKNKKLSILEDTSLKYFKLLNLRKKVSKNFKKKNINIKNKKIKKNFSALSIFYKNYQNVCIFFFNKFKKKNKKFVNDFLKNIDENLNHRHDKKDFKNWFIEICAARYLISKNYEEIDYIIDDEGFVQRSFTFAFQKKKINESINKYLKLAPKPDFIINIKSTKKEIINRSKHRLNSTDFMYRNDIEVNKFMTIETLINSKILKKTQILTFINKMKNFKNLNIIYGKIKK